jgi:D-serine deaminase-like pyridoxal phosphate-dependent protein
MARELGVFPPVVSVGSTPSCSVASAFEGVTELHPGVCARPRLSIRDLICVEY